MGANLRRQVHIFSSVIEAWAEIASDAAKWSLPLAVRFTSAQDNAGVLVVAITSGRGPEMQILSPKILARANSHLGYQALKRIQTDQSGASPVSKKEAHPPHSNRPFRLQPHEKQELLEQKQLITKALSQLDSPDLAEALENLFNALAEAPKT